MNYSRIPMSRNKTICQKYPSQKKSIYFHELNCVQKTAAVLTQVKEACRAAARATWKGWFNTFLSQNCPLLTHFWCLLELRKFKQRKMYFSSASTCLCSMCLTSPTGYKPRLQRHSKPLKGTQSAEAHAHFISFLSWFAYHKTRSWNRKWKAHPVYFKQNL